MVHRINSRVILLFLFTISIFVSCSPNNSSEDKSSATHYYDSQTTGIQNGGVERIQIETPKGKYFVWTKRYGNNPTKKLLLLNGGPGATHEYFECFESFLPKEGIEFIYYDQLACGNSDNPKDTSLYDLSRYVEEVEQVRIALHLDSSNCYLLGHSWGGLLAMQYALKYQQNIKGLIISNMMASCPEYGKYAETVLAKQMPQQILDSIMYFEKNGKYDDPKYMELLMPNFYAKHICRIPLDQWPEPVNRSFSKLNNELYVLMQGPSEFGVAGKLTNWDVSSELKNIKVPTLVIGATYDTMDPKYMEWMSKQIPHADFLLCNNGSHMSMYDDQQTYFNGLIKFLKK
jgi:proline iminopeptidase